VKKISLNTLRILLLLIINYLSLYMYVDVTYCVERTVLKNLKF